MNRRHYFFHLVPILISISLLLGACQGAPTPPPGSAGPLKVLAVETFLADMTQQVAGSRLKVTALIPSGVDPHSFEPTPNDVVSIAQSQVLVVNGTGFEEWLKKTLENAGGQRQVIDVTAGLTPRTPQAGELLDPGEHPQGDPHFWLDPIQGLHYVDAIRDGLIQADPAGTDVYTQNAAAYHEQIKALDAWISGQVKQIPPERRLLVTNHESFGYYADRYGFKIIGTIIPSVTTGASPSAQTLARLVDRIRASGAPAIFLETGTNPQVADQIAQETHIRVISDLYTHSTTLPGGNAPDYLSMLKWDTTQIVNALK